MRILPIEFTRFRFVFKQIKRVNNIALYSKSNAQGYIGYEIIRVQNRKEGLCFGAVIPEHEAYPHSESWGTNGWSAMTLGAANVIFDKVLKTTDLTKELFVAGDKAT